AAPLATSNRRKAGVPVAALRWIVSPLPTMVRLSLAAMRGRPVGPNVLLFTAVNEKGFFAASVMVLAPPARLAALMSAIRSETLAAVKLDGTVRSSSCSRPRRAPRRRGGRGRGLADPPGHRCHSFLTHMVDLLGPLPAVSPKGRAGGGEAVCGTMTRPRPRARRPSAGAGPGR